VIYPSVPHWLEALRALTPEQKSGLRLHDDPKGNNIGFVRTDPVGGECLYEVSLVHWVEHYIVWEHRGDPDHRADAIVNYRSDMRKLMLPTREDVVTPSPTDIATATHQSMPTAWERILDGDFED
jgi:hypothetical protein